MAETSPIVVQPKEGMPPPPSKLRLPGANCCAYIMLPFRVLFTVLMFCMNWPLLVLVAVSRALYLRCCCGKPSKILKYGAKGVGNGAGKKNTNHQPDAHYPCFLALDEPLEEEKFTKVVRELAAQDNIKEKHCQIDFMDEAPNDWHDGATDGSGSFQANHYVKGKIPKKGCCNPGNKTENVVMWGMVPGISTPRLKNRMKIRVFNAKEEGKPTVMWFAGSGCGWDGSSNFNFVKEALGRYAGNPPNDVFKRPELKEESKAKFDKGSFCCLLMRIPWYAGKAMLFTFWNMLRAFKIFGGNGFGPRIEVMNFSKEDSARLYAGAKAQGASPFSAMTYASVKACDEILKQRPQVICQQASLQTEHYPVPDSTTRDLVGDWLFGPVQYVPKTYTLADAEAAYQEMKKDIVEIGPMTQKTIWAKAYGILNNGAAMFEALPTYADDTHIMDRCIFMNNYGVRDSTVPLVWHWNAPMWWGVNTINVNGKTTTMVGSMLWGQEVVAAMRDHMEGTLREIMAHAPADGSAKVPTYGKKEV